MSAAEKRHVRFGIIGTGRIAGHFAEDLRLVRDVSLHSVLSRKLASAETFRQSHGAIRAFDSIDDFLSDADLDAVYVASPNSEHFGHALKAIRAGKAVLIEKPMALRAADASQIAKEAEKNGVFAMEAMWIRFLPGILQAKALLASGAIGEVTAVRGELSYENQYNPQNRLFDPKLGGGASLDLGVYLLSLTILLFGVPLNISGSWKAAPNGVDLSAAYSLAYPAFQADLLAGLDKTRGNSFEISGSQGVLRIDDPFIQGKSLRILNRRAATSKLLRQTFGRPMSKLQKLAMRMPIPGQRRWRFNYPGHGLQFQAEALANAVRHRETKPTIAMRSDSSAVLAIIEQVLAQKAERRPSKTTI